MTDEAGNVISAAESLEFTTDSLPGDFPPIRVTLSRPDRMEPGVTLFSVARVGDREYGLLVAVDESGEVVWYYRTDHGIGDARQTRAGNLLYLTGSEAVEIDVLGNVLQRWRASGPNGERAADSIVVEADNFHHEIYEMPSGNLLTLSAELRQLDGYPTSETDPQAPTDEATVAGDVIVEFERDGTIVDKWHLLDILNPYRIGYRSLRPVWAQLYPDVAGEIRDWTHSNAVIYDRTDDSLIVSPRHQDAVIKINRQTGELIWILGTHDGWGSEWAEYLLTPRGELQWPYHQHSPMITPEGNILLFDNGDFRSRPFQEQGMAIEPYSRAVEYAIDSGSMTISQVWVYGGPDDEFFYSNVGGDADLMPLTGNVLVTDGGRIDFDANISEERGGYRWARIVEVTHSTPPEKVFELIIKDETRPDPLGWAVFRSERLRSLRPSGFPK